MPPAVRRGGPNRRKLYVIIAPHKGGAVLSEMGPAVGSPSKMNKNKRLSALLGAGQRSDRESCAHRATDLLHACAGRQKRGASLWRSEGSGDRGGQPVLDDDLDRLAAV